MMLSGFRTMPRCGHLDRVRRVYGYLSKMKDAMICVHTAEPDYSGLPDQTLDWAQTVYGDVSKILPKDAPPPLGKYVTVTYYVDANLYHDMLTGRSITGILHLMNKTPIDWVHAKVPTFWIKRRADVRTVNDLPNVIRKDLESHGVANMFSNANPTATFLT
jgi:hypothetical protein